MSHVKYIVFQLAEVAVPCQMFARFWAGSAGYSWLVPRGEVRRAGQSGANVIVVRPRCIWRADCGGGMKEKGLVRWAQAATERIAAALCVGNRCNRSSEG
ncbi:MAG TPA: hypothetical protein VKD72_32835 [Gemmataceae bacterium]|nr:hypothetical protein [Gemmataceae bacterium]